MQAAARAAPPLRAGPGAILRFRGESAGCSARSLLRGRVDRRTIREQARTSAPASLASRDA
jgi:hypothetical protein